jgi:hypothetical protein
MEKASDDIDELNILSECLFDEDQDDNFPDNDLGISLFSYWFCVVHNVFLDSESKLSKVGGEKSTDTLAQRRFDIPYRY